MDRNIDIFMKHKIWNTYMFNTRHRQDEISSYGPFTPFSGGHLERIDLSTSELFIIASAHDLLG